MLSTTLLIAAALGAGPSFRCTDVAGVTTYSETVCPAQSKCLGFDRNKWSEAACVEARNPRPEGFRGDWHDACRSDLTCWWKKKDGLPYRICEERVESSAQYQFRWDDGWLESKTNLIGWADKRLGTVNIGGDKVSMQNGFGAWRRMMYVCTWDTIGDKLVEFAISPRP